MNTKPKTALDECEALRRLSAAWFTRYQLTGQVLQPAAPEPVRVRPGRQY